MNVAVIAGGEFSLRTLDAIDQSRHRLCGIVTKKDRPTGRRHRLRATPAGQWAVENGIPLLKRERVSDPRFETEFRSLNADAVLVADFGEILRPFVLQWAEKGFWGVHPSLLPRWRGAAPIPWTILSGDTLTGVTIFQLSAGVDSGRLALQTSCAIGPRETTPELEGRLGELAADLVVDFLDKLEKNQVTLEGQTEGRASRAPKVTRRDAFIDWNEPCDVLDRKIRALIPWPCAWFNWRKGDVKVLRAFPLSEQSEAMPGQFLGLWRNQEAGEGAAVSCAEGTLLLLEVQAAGRRALAANDWVNGLRLGVGDLLRL